MEFYKFHIDVTIEGKEVNPCGFANFVAQANCIGYHIVYEEGKTTKKPHYQGWFESEKNKKELKIMFLTIFPEAEVKGRGKQVYSLVTAANQGHAINYEDYMFKGNHVILSSIPPDVIAQRHAERKRKDEEKAAKKKLNEWLGNLTKYTKVMVEEFPSYLEKLKEYQHSDPLEGKDHEQKRDLAKHYVVEYVQSNSKIHDLHMIYKWILLIQSVYFKEDHTFDIMFALNEKYNI